MLSGEFEMIDLRMMHFNLCRDAGAEIHQWTSIVCHHLYQGHKLIRFCDLDWVGDVDNRTLVTSYYLSLGFGVVSWVNKKQPTIALSSTEANSVQISLLCFL